MDQQSHAQDDNATAALWAIAAALEDLRISMLDAADKLVEAILEEKGVERD